MIDLREHFLESVRDISEFVQFGQSEYRVVAGSKHLRDLLVEQLVLKVNSSIRVPIEFRVVGLPEGGPGSVAHWSRNALWSRPDHAPLSLQEFLKTPVLVLDGESFNVGNVIRVAANGSGGVHFGRVTRTDDVPFVTATANFSITDSTMSEFSAEASILPSIAAATLEALEPLIHAVRIRTSL